VQLATYVNLQEHPSSLGWDVGSLDEVHYSRQIQCTNVRFRTLRISSAKTFRTPSPTPLPSHSARTISHLQLKVLPAWKLNHFTLTSRPPPTILSRRFISTLIGTSPRVKGAFRQAIALQQSWGETPERARERERARARDREEETPEVRHQ
jgi:hypothetical protein